MQKHSPLYDKERVEWCCGGANMTQHFKPTYAIDSNHYIIAFWNMIQDGWTPPILTKEQYDDIKSNPDKHAPELVGWAGVGCSYCGKWFGGFASDLITKEGKPRYYQDEALRHVLRQKQFLMDTSFLCLSDLDKTTFKSTIKDACIYIDPPYNGTLKYKDDFNYEKFLQNCLTMARCSDVFVSEYEINHPNFHQIWEQPVTSSLRTTKSGGTAKQSIERLYIVKV